MQDVWICLVEVDPLLEGGLIVEVQRKAGEVVNARPFERPPRLDFENVVAAVTVLVDPSADRVARISWLVVRGQSRPSVEDST